ncbi:uncharacterized protein PSFLO_02145 [Pseudozyma flocculosa]|uniref:Uncharacterized protein n=1 Tax=Pseudozyma flocculosa TaxID=84751 RepID=A0A5C3EWP7_9BASI|nr:uncharacterized protein PSFLO_02145 [Pseudozyma flocculosa]
MSLLGVALACLGLTLAGRGLGQASAGRSAWCEAAALLRSVLGWLDSLLAGPACLLELAAACCSFLAGGLRQPTSADLVASVPSDAHSSDPAWHRMARSPCSLARSLHPQPAQIACKRRNHRPGCVGRQGSVAAPPPYEL